MQSRLGTFLRRLRRQRSLSQEQAAQAAKISRVTLSRWENDLQEPRIHDLLALFSALSVGAQERIEALSLLDSPAARTQIRKVTSGIGTRKGIGEMPHGGDLIRALRLRKGLSQEDAAPRIGVSTRTLYRWEKAEVWPNDTQIHTLCFALGAHEAEVSALTSPHLSRSAEPGHLSKDEIWDKCQKLHHYTDENQNEALRELGFFALEAQAWPGATDSLEGQLLLSRIYSCHANYYSSRERHGESGTYAAKSLDLVPTWVAPTRGAIQAGIILANSMVFKKDKPSPQRGLRILKYWLEAAQWPDFQGWILANMATYEGLSGNTASSLTLARKASEVAEYCDRPYEIYLRELDEVKVLVEANEPHKALSIIENERIDLQPEHQVQFQLLKARAHMMLQENGRASEQLQLAFHLIDAHSLLYLRHRAEEIADKA
ncbi:MAG: helix-turn-helix domain-containing protein [Proteobacteria bacterium]|nr:MAG: helix-turn-helix domain-containing protein [Pseudomonadota bacterium]